MARPPATSLSNNPLAISWGYALRILRGNEHSSKIATILSVSNSFLRLLEVGATTMTSNKALKLIRAFPQLEFQPASKFFTVLNITSAATDSYTEYLATLIEIRELNRDDDYYLDKLLEKLEHIITKEKVIDRSVLEPILAREKFAEDIIKYMSTRIFRRAELQIMPDEQARQTEIYDEYDSTFHSTIQDTPAIYMNSFSQLIFSLRHINPNMFVNETNKWEEQYGKDFVSVVGVFRSFLWMLEPENLAKFPLRYILNHQFKELHYVVVGGKETGEVLTKKFQDALLQVWRYESKETAPDDYVRECLEKVVIKKATLEIPFIKDFLTTSPDRINELVWVFTTEQGLKVGFSILPQNAEPNVAYGEALTYGVSKRKSALFNAIWDSLK